MPNPDDPIHELLGCHAMAFFKKGIAVYDVLASAYFERTGLVFEPETEFTIADLRRASRLLRTRYDRDGNRK